MARSMRRQHVLVAAMMGSLLAGATSDPAAAAPAAGEQQKLDRPPVCEPSAALAVRCTDDASATCVWVGDNERDEEIFQYRIGAGGELEPAATFALEPKGLEVGDVEALAQGKDGVLVFGSHSRKSDCTDDHGRAALALVGADGKKAESLAGRKGFEDRFVDCTSWLALDAGASPEATALRDRFCTVMRAEERIANVFEGDKKSCPGTAFNIEGAVSVEQGGALRTWVGLRGPLVDGRAVLLRVADPPAPKKKRRMRFDGIATVDLGERGIRELTLAGDTIWGIAGCVPDCTVESRLWRTPAAKLTSGARIAASDAGIVDGVELPPSAEGLVVQSAEKRAIVLVDGTEGENDDTCGEPKPGQLTIEGLP